MIIIMVTASYMDDDVKNGHIVHTLAIFDGRLFRDERTDV